MNWDRKGNVSRQRLLAVLVVSSVMGGCGGDDDVSTDESDIVVRANVQNKVNVEADRLTFDAEVARQLENEGILTKLDAYAEAEDKSSVDPVFMVGKRASDAVRPDGTINEESRNPFGYLRRALSWERAPKGKLIVKTAPASIPEAAKELKARGLLLVTPDSSKTVRPRSGRTSTAEATEGLTKTWREEFGGPRTIDLLDTKVKDKSGREVSLRDRPLFAVKGSFAEAEVRLKTAKIELAPRFEGEVNVTGLTTNKGFAELTGEADVEIEFEATSTGTIDIPRAGTYHVVTIGGAFQGFPLSLSVDVEWACGLGISGEARVSIGAKAEGAIGAKAEFTNFAVTPTLEPPTHSFEAIGPKFDAQVAVRGKCEVTPKLLVRVFDAAGPEASLNLWTEINASTTGRQTSGEVSAKLTAGGEFRFGGALKPFGVSLLTIDADPIRIGPEGGYVLFDEKVAVGR